MQAANSTSSTHLQDAFHAELQEAQRQSAALAASGPGVDESDFAACTQAAIARIMAKLTSYSQTLHDMKTVKAQKQDPLAAHDLYHTIRQVAKAVGVEPPSTPPHTADRFPSALLGLITSHFNDAESRRTLPTIMTMLGEEYNLKAAEEERNAATEALLGAVHAILAGTPPQIEKHADKWQALHAIEQLPHVLKAVPLSKLNAVLDFLQQHCPELRVFHFPEGTPLGSTSQAPLVLDLMRKLAAFPKLDTVSFSNSEGLTDDAFSILARDMKSLRSLTLSHCSRLTPKAFTAQDEKGVSNAHYLKELTHLCLNDMPAICEETIVEVTTHMHELEHLELAYGRQDFSDASLGLIGRNLPKLRHLVLPTNNLTDAAFTEHAAHFRELLTLNLNYCAHLTDSSLMAIATHMPLLTSLGLPSQVKLAPPTAHALGTQLQALTSLKARGFLYHLPVEGLATLLARAKLCIHLDLSYSCDTGLLLEAITAHLPRLRSLDLSDCIRSTNLFDLLKRNNAANFGERLQNLEQLNLQCCYFDRAAADALFPHLKQLTQARVTKSYLDEELVQHLKAQFPLIEILKN